MTLRRRIDHRNSRIHHNSPRPVAPGPMLTLIDAARSALARIFASGRATAPQTIVLRNGNKHGFTVLGAAILPHAVRHLLPANDLSDR